MHGQKLNNTTFHIKERSWIAWVAAKKLHASAVAIVIGKTIHLHNTSRQEFLRNKRWVKHEICHVRQFEQYGFCNFIVKYIWESARNGYYNNRFEREAREAEREPDDGVNE